MARKKVEKRQSVRTALSRSPELQQVSRQLAVLALAQMQQDETLGVRQGEQLRRALASAGDVLGWNAPAAISGDPIAELSKEVMTIVKSGAKAIAKDLAEELADKRIEAERLADTANGAREMSENSKATYPAEISYAYSVRDASATLVTKTENITVNDSGEALSAAETIEKNTTSRGKLTNFMIIDLEKKQVQLELMAKSLPDFVMSTHAVLGEVIANL